jgi:hypothetical protein
VYLALRDGPRGFRQSFSCSALLRYRLRVQIVFAYAAITLYGAPSQRASTNDWIGNSTIAGPATPAGPKSNGFGLMRFRSPLLSQSRFLSFPSGTEMVHFPELARTRLWIHRAVHRFYQCGFPHSDIPESKPVAAHRGLSQLATSFIAIFCQGIHHAPLVT